MRELHILGYFLYWPNSSRVKILHSLYSWHLIWILNRQPGKAGIDPAGIRGVIQKYPNKKSIKFQSGCKGTVSEKMFTDVHFPQFTFVPKKKEVGCLLHRESGGAYRSHIPPIRYVISSKATSYVYHIPDHYINPSNVSPLTLPDSSPIVIIYHTTHLLISIFAWITPHRLETTESIQYFTPDPLSHLSWSYPTFSSHPNLTLNTDLQLKH